MSDERVAAHVTWLRQYARGARQAAKAQSGVQRARSEEMADRLLAAAAALLGFRFADYARVEQVAARLGIHVESARRLMREGTLPAQKVRGRWLMRWEELEAFAEGYAWGARGGSRWEADPEGRPDLDHATAGEGEGPGRGTKGYVLVRRDHG